LSRCSIADTLISIGACDARLVALLERHDPPVDNSKELRVLEARQALGRWCEADTLAALVALAMKRSPPLDDYARLLSRAGRRDERANASALGRVADFA
jgi:hypothetical protein